MEKEKKMLIMRNVSKTFNPGTVNEKAALKNLNLILKEGDFATIVGTARGNLPYLMRSQEHFMQTGVLSC